MNITLVARVIGGLLLFLSATLLTPVPFGIYESVAYERFGATATAAGAAEGPSADPAADDTAALTAAAPDIAAMVGAEPKAEEIPPPAPAPDQVTYDNRWGRTVLPFLVAALLAALAGWPLARIKPSGMDLTHREGFAIVTLCWLVFAVFGGLPYLLAGTMSDPIDAFFESMSGFTTTGSTVITDLSVVSNSVLFWRSLTQWLGGMGIIVLSLAILPFLGVGGMQLFEAEAPGPTSDRLFPRIQDTAKALWGVYFLLTFGEMLLLWASEMTAFDALCHSLTTMATGGFSTKNLSIGHYGDTVHWIVAVFMFLAGVNFSLQYFALRGRWRPLYQSEEVRFYALTALCVAGTLTLMHMMKFGDEPFLRSLRDCVFMTLSIVTTTGYGTGAESGDYDNWYPMARYLLFVCMFLGGCAGSTSGGMKVIRIQLAIKHGLLQIYRLVHPREIRRIRQDHKSVSPEIIQSVLSFVVLFIGLFVLASITLAGLETGRTDDVGAQTDTMLGACSAVIACLGNIGPGLGAVGPTDTFAAVSDPGKLLLAMCMLIGRLEVYTVLVLLLPSCWKK